MNNLLNISNQIQILQSVFENSLDEKSPRIHQPELIKTQLLKHQLAEIYEMRNRVENAYSGQNWKTDRVFSKIGILGDNHNSGKTLTTLGFIASNIENPIKISTLHIGVNSNEFFYNIQTYTEDQSSIPINLIVVPTNLLYQWTNILRNETLLKHTVIEGKRHFPTNQAIIEPNTIFLTHPKIFRQFHKFCENRNLVFRFIFFDEAPQLYFSANDPKVTGAYIWFITSEWSQLIIKSNIKDINVGVLYNSIQNTIENENEIQNVSNEIVTRNKNLISSDGQYNIEFKDFLENSTNLYHTYLTNNTYIKYYIPFYHEARYVLVLRSKKSFIDLELPEREETKTTVQCRPVFTLSSMKTFFTLQGNVERLHECIPYILRDLNVPIKTKESLIEQEFKGNEQLYESRIGDDCSVCLESPNYSLLTPCCCRIYCTACLFKNIFMGGKCPTCRTILSIDTLCSLSTPNDTLYESMLTKNELLINTLKDFSDNQTIVYQHYPNAYYNIKDVIDNLGITSDILEYNLFASQKKIRDFQEKKFKVLFVSDTQILQLYGLLINDLDRIVFYNNPLYSDLCNLVLNCSRKNSKRVEPIRVVTFSSVFE